MIKIGRRAYNTDEFKWFYCPLLKKHRKQYYHFFFWFGKHWYICWHKKNPIVDWSK